MDRIAELTFIAVPALAEGLWQGVAVTIAGALVIRLLRFKAATRHKLLLMLLILVCAVPIIVLLFHLSVASSGSATTQSIQASHSLFHIPLYGAMALLSGIICISLIRLLVLAGSFMSLWKLRKFSKEASNELQQMLQECIAQKNLNRSVTLRITSNLNSPALIGFFRPIILIPDDLLIHLETQELRQILNHELAHLDRFDDWTFLLQRILTSLFIFQPAVFWIGKQMNLEREIACDDSVIESGELPRSYALCLTRLAEFASNLSPVTIVSAGSQLSRRIDMLLTQNEIQRSGVSRVALMAGIILVVGGGLWIGQEGSLLAISNEANNQANQGSTFTSAQQRFEEARIKLEEAREEMLAAGEAMRNAQKETASEERQDKQIRRKMKLAVPEAPPKPVLALVPSAPPAIAPPTEAPPAIAAPAEAPPTVATPPRPPLPETEPTPELAPIPELPPTPETPPPSWRWRQN